VKRLTSEGEIVVSVESHIEKIYIYINNKKKSI
jgi:hypothetical protein